MTRMRFRHLEDGEIRESDLIVCLPSEWDDAPERQQAEWCAGVSDVAEEIDGLMAAAPRHLIFALRLGERGRSSDAAEGLG